MLDQLFRRSGFADRLRFAPYGQHLEEFAICLNDRGHACETMRLYVWAAAEFVRWLASKAFSLDVVDARLVNSFLDEAETKSQLQPPVRKPRKNVRSGLKHFLELMRSKGHVPAAIIAQSNPTDILLAEYRQFLRNTAGLSESTCRHRTYDARKFLHHHFGDGPVCCEQLHPTAARSSIVEIAQTSRPGSGSELASSLRSFLRWMLLHGRCSPSLVLAVPCFRDRNRGALPKVMNDDQLQKFLGQFDRSTPIGRRNYAMALCQTDLGFRVSEVVALKLDDIDWRSGTIRIVGGKACRERVLPLTESLGRAFAEYIQHGRPVTSCRHVFVRSTVPSGTPVTRYLIAHVFRRTFNRLEDCKGWAGTHALRHTAATRMYRKGATLKEIGDILGHQRLNSTSVYTRVEQSQLSVVAMSWPKEAQP